MQIDKTQNFLAVITGKNLIMGEQKPNQIFIFKRTKNLNATSDVSDKFDLLKNIIIKDNPELEKICMQFYFKNTKYGRDPDTLIFARQHEITQLNFITNEIHDLALFDTPLTMQPSFFLLTENQKIAIIASYQDGIYFNMTSGAWVDLDEYYNIGCICEIIQD